MNRKCKNYTRHTFNNYTYHKISLGPLKFNNKLVYQLVSKVLLFLLCNVTEISQTVKNNLYKIVLKFNRKFEQNTE